MQALALRQELDAPSGPLCGSALDGRARARSPAEVDCTRCGRRNPPHVRYCLDCGSHLEQQSKTGNLCPSCNTRNPLDARYCRECGGSLQVPSEPGAPASEPDEPASSPPGILELEEPTSSVEMSKLPPRPVEPLPSGHSASGATSKRCHRCRGHSSPSAAFCQFCGAPFHTSESAARPRSHPPLYEATGRESPRAELVVIAQDGSPGRRYAIEENVSVIGSSESATIALRRDPYVCAEHARVLYRNGGYSIEDISPVNGVYVRIGGAVPLQSGDLLLLGLAVLSFEVMEEAERHLSPKTRNGTRLFGTPPSPRYARLSLKTVEDTQRDVFYLSRAETVLGREVGDVVFTDDPFMSRRHAAIRRDPNSNQFSIRDLGSSNGTFVAIRGRHAVSHGDHIRIGQHLFRLDVRRSD